MHTASARCIDDIDGVLAGLIENCTWCEHLTYVFTSFILHLKCGLHFLGVAICVNVANTLFELV